MNRVNGQKANGCVKHVATLRALADHLQISYSSAKDLKRDGLSANGHGYSLVEARKLLSVRALRARDLVRGGDTTGLDLKKRKLDLDCQLRQLDLEIAKGLWVHKAAVEREWRSKLILVREHLKNLGRTVAPLCVDRKVAEIEQVISRRIYEILKLLCHAEYCPPEKVLNEPHNSPTKEAP